MILDNSNRDKINSNDIETVQQKEHEYHLLGSFIRTKGLTLYGFDRLNDKVYELKINYSDTITLVPVNGELIPIDMEAQKTTIDSKHEVFEALNYTNAIKRVAKYKEGKIKELNNLMKPNPEGMSIKLF